MTKKTNKPIITRKRIKRPTLTIGGKKVKIKPAKVNYDSEIEQGKELPEGFGKLIVDPQGYNCQCTIKKETEEDAITDITKMTFAESYEDNESKEDFLKRLMAGAKLGGAISSDIIYPPFQNKNNIKIEYVGISFNYVISIFAQELKVDDNNIKLHTTISYNNGEKLHILLSKEEMQDLLNEAKKHGIFVFTCQ